MIDGYDYVGGLVGNALARVTLSLCEVYGSISGNSQVGGLLGQSSSAVLQNCDNYASVNGEYYVGGIVGNTDSATVQFCTNNGSVNANHSAGGIVGAIQSNLSYIANISACRNWGDVATTSVFGKTGGLVGYIAGTGYVNINDCGVEKFSISGNGNSGVFLGECTNSNAVVENCYAVYNGNLSAVGNTSGTFRNCMWIRKNGGVTYKEYCGTNFSAFAWPNRNSCPIPKGLAWIGQIWPEDITSEILTDSSWKAVNV